MTTTENHLSQINIRLQIHFFEDKNKRIIHFFEDKKKKSSSENLNDT